MACQINRTKDGKINEVTTPTGAKSKLFEAIHSNIFLADAETSVKVYNNAYSEKVEKMFEGETSNKYDTGEPQLFYKAPSNKVYDSLEEVLIFEELGEISMGFKNPKSEEFIPVAKFTNKGSEKNEFLSAKVREGLLSADRVLGTDGVTRFQGKGSYTTTRKTTALFVQTDLKGETGNGRVKILDDGTIEIEFAKGYSEVIDENGNSSTIKTENIPEYLEKNPNTENKVELITEYVLKHDDPRPLDTATEDTSNKTVTDLTDLENSLMAFLNGLGFTTTSLESYRKNYNTKHGEGTDISALADMANQVIAFRNGEISAEDLSEEVAHVAIEAYADQGSIITALANVHLTPEYAELSEKYRKRYSEDGLSDIELEDKVRKEILGKLLKKELMSRFNTNNRTSEDSYLIGKLKSIWEYFMNMLKVNAKPYHVELLNELNETIADSILNNNSQDFLEESLKDNPNYFYSLMGKSGQAVYDELKKGREQIQVLYNNYLKEPSPSLVKLDGMTSDMSDYKAISGVHLIVETASEQMKVLENAVKASVKNKTRLDKKNVSRYEHLKSSLIPTINTLLLELKENSEHITDKKLLGEIERLRNSRTETIEKLADVEPSINTDKLAYVDRILEKIMEHTSVTDEQKKEIRANLKGGTRDLSILGKMFGLSSHSKNIALQLMHFSVMNISARTNRKFLSRMNELITGISLEGGLKHQKNIINRDANGKATYHLDSARDYEWADRVTKEKKISIIARMTNNLVEESPSEEQLAAVEKSLETKLPEELLSEEQFTDFQEELKTFVQEEVREKRFKPSYYIARDKRFDDAKVSETTRTYLSQKNSAMNLRHMNGGHITPDGTKDLSNQTEEEKRRDQEDKHRHKLVASPYDTMGNVKQGLKRVKLSELTAEERASIPVEIDEDFTGDVTIMEEGLTLEDLENLYPDSRLSLDIFNHNMAYRNELKEQSRDNNATKEFFEKIKELEDKGEVGYDWLISNSTLSISTNFYEGMSEGLSMDELTQEYIDNIEDTSERESKQNIFDEVRELKRSRSELLKQNKKAHSVLEYDAFHMTPSVSSRVLELDSLIYNATRDLAVPYEVFEELEGRATKSELNEDYYLMFKDSNITSEYEFALKHAPEHSQENIRAFSREAKDYINKRSSFIKPKFAAFIERAIEDGVLGEEKLTKDEILEILKAEYAKDNVASYFKRFAPEGYNKALEALKTGEISTYDFLKNKEKFIEKYPALEYIEFSPDYTWRSDVTNEDNLNPKYMQGDISNQPRKLNDSFFEKYFIDTEAAKEAYLNLEEENLSLLTPTKNQEQYKYLIATVNINKEIIENYEMTGKTNPYLRVQMKKSDFERMLTLHKSGSGSGLKSDLGDWLNDLTRSQIDEMEYGQQIEGSDINIKQIPKYYQQRVDNPSFLTENTLQASLTSLKASIKYKERLLAEDDVKAIEYQISQQKFKSSGGNSIRARLQKKGEVSNYYLKAQEMADYHLYGIRQNRKMITTVFGKEVDFTQIISRFTEYVRNVNLAYNPLVDITSYTTGVFNNLVDTAVGDYYHKSSVAEASKRLPNLMRLYMAQEGSVKKTSELNHLLEWLNVFSEDERLSMSSYNRGVRVLSNSFYLGSKIANLPVTPRNMLAILYDTKFHNGKFKSYNEFARDIRNESEKKVKRTEMESLWRKQTDTFYSNIKIDPDLGILMGDNFKEKFGEKAEEEFDFYHTKLTSKITQVNQSVDAIVSNEDQTMGQRDALTNSFLMHRSWFIINMTRKFKKRHFNAATGQFEAGHYNTAWSTLKKLAKNITTKKEKQELRKTLEEFEVRNLIRAGVDAAGILLLVALSNALMDNDDDDDSWMENLAQLIAMRTTNETQSQHAIGIPGTVEDMYDDLLVQRKMVGQVAEGLYAYATGSDDQKVKDNLWRQNIYGRRRHQLDNLDSTLRIYMKYNKDQLWWVDAAQAMPDPR